MWWSTSMKPTVPKLSIIGLLPVRLATIRQARNSIYSSTMPRSRGPLAPRLNYSCLLPRHVSQGIT